MKYMVMECHLSYAVVLDESGRFLKVANRQYEVGQTVTDVIEMQVPQSIPKSKKNNKLIYLLIAMAAVLMLVVTSILQKGQTYASVYLSINPEVKIDVNRHDEVITLDGINTDGKKLVKGCDYKKKKLDTVIDELVDRAIEIGFLHEGGKITLTLDSENDKWVVSHSESLSSHLNDYVKDKISVTIEVADTKNKSNKIIIPVVDDDNENNKTDSTETDYEPNDNDDNDIEYVPNKNDSDYKDKDYNSNKNNLTDYKDKNHKPKNDNITDDDDDTDNDD